MKRYKVFYEDGAKGDILNIIKYIEDEYSDFANATKVAMRIYRKCESLSLFPKASPIRREWSRKKELRAIHIKKYIIIYYVDDEECVVNIRAVVNSRRDLGAVVKE